MKTIVRPVFVAGVAMLASLCIQDAPAGGVRLLSVQPACFEFMFMSVVSTGDDPVFALNHLNGGTRFARVGERVGDYEIRRHRIWDAEVFDPSINARRRERRAEVVLAGGDGGEVTLVMGEVLPGPGLMGAFMSLDSERHQYATAGDALRIGSVPATLLRVSAEDAEVSIGGARHVIPLISEAGVTMLEQRRAARTLARAREAQTAREQERARQERMDRALSNAIAVQRGQQREAMTLAMPRSTGFFFGTECPVPIEYNVIPIRIRRPDGTITFRPVAVPVRFGVYQSGFGMRYPR